MRVLQKLLSVELANERLIDLAAGEVEAGEVAIVREAGGLELIGRRSHLPVGKLGIKTSPIASLVRWTPPAASQRQGGAIALGLLDVVACNDPQRRNSLEHFRD
jgi:hypothetical protein